MAKKILQHNGWTKDDIQNLLLNNDRAVVRAVVALYRTQTEAEKATTASLEKNGVGFTKFDAPYLCTLAQRLLEGKPAFRSDIRQARIRVLKYWKQLMMMARPRPVEIQPSEIRIDVFSNEKSGWAQPKAVRITHLPTGIFSQSSEHRSQHANRHYAMEALKVKLTEHQKREYERASNGS